MTLSSSTTSSYSNCYTASTGAVFYVDSTGTKTLNFNTNTFTGNAAVTGGSIYCISCGWTLIKNTFTNSVAYNGGHLYIEKPTGSAVTFDSTTCTGNIATNYGGCVYYTENAISANTALTINIASGGTSTWSSN